MLRITSLPFPKKILCILCIDVNQKSKYIEPFAKDSTNKRIDELFSGGVTTEIEKVFCEGHEVIPVQQKWQKHFGAACR